MHNTTHKRLQALEDRRGRDGLDVAALTDAELTAIVDAGRAHGFDASKLSDAQLQAIVRGNAHAQQHA